MAITKKKQIDEIIGRIKSCSINVKFNFYQIGVSLNMLRNITSQTEFVEIILSNEKDFGFGLRRSYDFMRTAKYFTEEEISSIGVDKLLVILSASRKEKNLLSSMRLNRENQIALLRNNINSLLPISVDRLSDTISGKRKVLVGITEAEIVKGNEICREIEDLAVALRERFTVLELKYPYVLDSYDRKTVLKIHIDKINEKFMMLYDFKT